MVTGTDQESQVDVTLETENTETPKDEPQYTQAQLDTHGDEKAQQAKSAALADIGRLQKESQNAMKAATSAGARVKRMLQEMEDTELKAAEGNTEQLSAVTERHKRRQLESDLEDAKLELDGKNEQLTQLEADKAEATKGRTAREIAARLGVDPERVIKFSKYTDGSAEAIEELARDLPKKELRAPVETDSGANTGGGGGNFTMKQIDAMSDEEYLKNKDAIEKAQMAGKIK